MWLFNNTQNMDYVEYQKTLRDRRKDMFGKKKEKVERPTQQEMRDSYVEYIAAEEELKRLRKEHGIEDPDEGKISKRITKYFDDKENREKVAVSKKKYIWLTVLTGWMGGHRFYAKRYKLGVLYLLFFWTGVPLYNCIIDLMQIIPIPADENGIIYI